MAALDCHPEQGEGSFLIDTRSFALLRMTKQDCSWQEVLGMDKSIPYVHKKGRCAKYNKGAETMANRILVVDDEKNIIKGIKFSLEQDGIEVSVAYDGEEALAAARDGNFDLIVLDVMLPKLDGLEVCQSIREFSDTPIIMLTAKSEDMDKIMGLEYGADDYITKPFNILELKARIKAILRRSGKNNGKAQAAKSVHNVRGLGIEVDSRRVNISGNEVNLTAKEFDLLELLMENAERVYTREELLNTVWGYDYPGDVRTVDVHVRRLREKIEDAPSDPKYIHTKWGVGYYFK